MPGKQEKRPVGGLHRNHTISVADAQIGRRGSHFQTRMFLVVVER
jgi:hypothetical protein